jgi:hypothetical protein
MNPGIQNREIDSRTKLPESVVSFGGSEESLRTIQDALVSIQESLITIQRALIALKDAQISSDINNIADDW